jgi:site-specific DNA-cytosine methylase
MSSNRTHSTRRAFFLKGGAVLGAGVAAGASALGAEKRPDASADREAVRQLHLAFAALIEAQDYDAAAQLFDDQAQLDAYRQQSAPSRHAAYRSNSRQQHDVVTLSDDRLHATATYHVDAQIHTPLQGDSTPARMARLQGNPGDSRWEAGRLEAQYLKRRGEWKIASLSYAATG